MSSRPAPHHSLIIALTLFAAVIAVEWGVALTRHGTSPVAAVVAATVLFAAVFGLFYRLAGPAG